MFSVVLRIYPLLQQPVSWSHGSSFIFLTVAYFIRLIHTVFQERSRDVAIAIGNVLAEIRLYVQHNFQLFTACSISTKFRKVVLYFNGLTCAGRSGFSIIHTFALRVGSISLKVTSQQQSRQILSFHRNCLSASFV